MAIRSRAGVESSIQTLIADNTTGDITAGEMREILGDINESSADLRDTIWSNYMLREASEEPAEEFSNLDLSSRTTLNEANAAGITGTAMGFIFRFDSSTSDREFDIEFNVADKSAGDPDNWDAFPSSTAPEGIRAPAGSTYASVVILNAAPFRSTHSSAPAVRWVPGLVGHGSSTPDFTNFQSQMFHLEWMDDLLAPSVDLFSGNQTLNSGDNATTYTSFQTPIDPQTHPHMSTLIYVSGLPNHILQYDFNRHTATEVGSLSFPSDSLRLVWIDSNVPPREAVAGSINGNNGWVREFRIAHVLVDGSAHMIGGLYVQWLINNGSTTTLQFRDSWARSSRI